MQHVVVQTDDVGSREGGQQATFQQSGGRPDGRIDRAVDNHR